MTDFIVRAPDDGFSNESRIGYYFKPLMHPDSFDPWRNFCYKGWTSWEKERRKAKIAKIHGLKELIEDLRPTREIEPEILPLFSNDYYFINGSLVSKMAWDLTIILDWMESKNIKNTMPDRYEAIKRSKYLGVQKEKEMKMLAQTCEFLKKYALSNYMKELLAENAEAEIAEALSRENILMIFLTVILFITNFLSMFISSRCKKRYILLWTDKAVLLVLWTCGDVELNPGPVIKRLARSEVLRKFQRCTQTLIAKLIYEKRQTKIPKSLYKQGPPGWKWDLKFKNISNINSGGEEIFDKLIILFKETWDPLPPGWDNLLKHYQDLDENNNEESKNALESWMLEIDFVPKILLHASINGESSTDPLEAFKHVLKRWQDTCGIHESTCATTFPFLSNGDKETLFSSSSKSTTIERAVQQNVVSDKTESMLRVPLNNGSNKSESPVVQREETARQSYESRSANTEMTHTVKKSNTRTAKQLQLNPELCEHVQNNSFIFEETMSKREDNQLSQGTHNSRTPNQMQIKRRLPDADLMLNIPKVPRNNVDNCKQKSDNMIENIHLEKPAAEQLTSDVQRNNNAEQSPTITLDSDKNQSYNENSLDCQNSPVHTVLNDQNKRFLEEDVFDEFLINNLYQTFLVPDFLRKYLCELKLGTVQPLAEVTELCQRILNIHTCRCRAVEIKQ